LKQKSNKEEKMEELISQKELEEVLEEEGEEKGNYGFLGFFNPY